MKKNQMMFTRVLVLGVFGIVILAGAPLSHAETYPATTSGSLESEIQGLALPTDVFENQSAKTGEENLYAFQERFSPLQYRGELSLAGGRNFSGDSFLVTQQLELTARFHLSNRWSIGLSGATVFNNYSDAADRLYEKDGIVPDVAFAKSRADLMVHYNTFYGKMRPGFDSTVYFDQYVGLGAGKVNTNTISTNEAVVDLGFAFWLNKWGSLRVGAKDYIFKEERLSGAQVKNNVTGYLGLGVLL